jgi:hypothetical protein
MLLMLLQLMLLVLRFCRINCYCCCCDASTVMLLKVLMVLLQCCCDDVASRVAVRVAMLSR